MGVMNLLGMGGDTQDYNEAAWQQYQANLQAARAESYANNPNIYTPQGQRVTGIDPVTGQPSIYESLNPEEQDLYNRDLVSRQRRSAILNDAGMPAIEQAMKTGYTLPGQAQTGFDSRYEPTTGMGYGIGQKGRIQSALDFSGAPGMPQADSRVRDQVTRSIYDQGARFLDDRFAGQQKAMDVRTSNQGLFPGGEGYGAATKGLGDERTMAYGDLIDRAIQGGGDAMEQLYQMAMGARQQGVGEISAKGEFANAAQGQDVDQMLAELAARNAAVTNQYGVAANQAGTANAGRSQGLAELDFAHNAPINAANALNTGVQVSPTPTTGFNPTAIQAAPVFQGIKATGDEQTASSNRTAGLWGQAIGAVGKSDPNS